MAVVAQAAFLLTELRSRSPMLQLSLFRNRTVLAALTSAGLVSFGMFGTFFFLSLYLQNIQGYSALGMGIRALAISGMIIVTAPLAGRIAGRIGSRIPMTIGLALNGVGLLLLTRITPTMSYSLLWWNLAMLGVGMGLVMTPMTAAVMSAVPRARAGMASATTNATREIGGVFGIALLGAIVTHWFASDLSSKLRGFALPAAVKAQIVALASHGGEEATKALPPGVNAQALHATIDTAFVSGMHVALIVAGIALLLGSAVAGLLMRSGVPAEEVVPSETAGAAGHRRHAGGARLRSADTCAGGIWRSDRGHDAGGRRGGRSGRARRLPADGRGRIERSARRRSEETRSRRGAGGGRRAPSLLRTLLRRLARSERPLGDDHRNSVVAPRSRHHASISAPQPRRRDVRPRPSPGAPTFHRRRHVSQGRGEALRRLLLGRPFGSLSGSSQAAQLSCERRKRLQQEGTWTCAGLAGCRRTYST